MAVRSLYLILAKSVQQLLYLRHAVATILGFVGFKSMRIIITTLLSRTPSPPSPPLTHTIAFSLFHSSSGPRVLPRARLLLPLSRYYLRSTRCGHDRVDHAQSAGGRSWAGGAQGPERRRKRERLQVDRRRLIKEREDREKESNIKREREASAHTQRLGTWYKSSVSTQRVV